MACLYQKIVFNQSAYCWHATKLVLVLTAEKGKILPLTNNIFFASRPVAAFFAMRQHTHNTAILS
jgi:hypothetical protein